MLQIAEAGLSEGGVSILFGDSKLGESSVNHPGVDRVSFTGAEARLECGWYVRPTLFAEVDKRMKIAREEIFGPVLSVIWRRCA